MQCSIGRLKGAFERIRRLGPRLTVQVDPITTAAASSAAKRLRVIELRPTRADLAKQVEHVWRDQLLDYH